MRIVIIGMGYVGLVTTACLAEQGNEIIKYDKIKEFFIQIIVTIRSLFLFISK